MQAGGLVVIPGVKRFLPEGFALLLASHILLYGLAHQPVHRSTALIGQRAHPRFQWIVEAYRNRG
jgi:hypothetical protein